jgi:hypothetical protein
MDEHRIKQAVLAVIERSLDAHALATAVGSAATAAPPPERAAEAPGARPSANKLLSRIVLGDILDDAILGARPSDRTFPLRLFFSELGVLLASDEDDDGEKVHAAEAAFALASGLNFFFRADMDGEARVRVAVEASRAFYALAGLAQGQGQMDPELVGKAAPLLAALMSQSLERVKLESVDHARVFDSQVHERTASSDPSSSRIVRPASFLCRVTTNNAVKAKAQVVT